MKKNIKRIILFLISLVLIPYFSCFADDVLEHNSDEEISNILQTAVSTSDIPVINSRSAIIYERNSKRVLWGKNENEKRKMASTTKIMTALVVLENVNSNDIVTVSSKAASTGGSRLGLSKNAKISVNDLLYGLLLCSGNDAAVALAEYTSRKC